MRDGEDHVYVIEVNPRASRTVPYVSKATGIPLAKIGARLMTGRTLRELLPNELASRQGSRSRHAFLREVARVSVEQVRRSRYGARTGDEVHRRSDGCGDTFGEAFAKAQLSAGQVLPTTGTVFFTVNDHDKPAADRTRHAATSIWAFRSSPPRERPTCWSARAWRRNESSR